MALEFERLYTLSQEPLECVRDFLRPAGSKASLRSREPRVGSSFPHSKRTGHCQYPVRFGGVVVLKFEHTPRCSNFVALGGERGIRTPGKLPFNGFQDRRIRPLCHLSV